MYDSARDCFTEQQVAEQKALAAEAATRADKEREPRRRISTVGDLLSPVDDASSPPTTTPTLSKPPSSSSPTTTTPAKMPDSQSSHPLKRKERERGGTPPRAREDDTKRRRGNSPHHDDRRRRHDRGRDDDHGGKRRRAGGGGSGSSPRERNIYAPRRRSRSRSPRGDRQPYQRRPVSPGGRYRYRSPPPPLIPRRDPSPSLPSTRDTSPPRQRKRPGQSARLTEAEREAHRAAIAKREAEAARLAKESVQARGVNEIVKAHYNDKRELGKTWRETHSQIKGLRSFNNWVKSTIIQKFSPNDGFDPRSAGPNSERIFVLDMGCGKGGDLLKWKSAPQSVELYVGVDTADVSIDDARERYNQMRGGHRRGGRQLFDGRFYAMDCWSHWIGELPIIADIGADPNVGPGATATRWSKGGGFDVVTMMFCMHYAFESETKCATMLRNVAGALKKGGRFIGTIPSSDVISSRVRGEHLDPEKKKEMLPEEGEGAENGVQEWGNSKYRVRFAEPPPRSGVFRPPWGWRYSFFLEEAVEEVPEYVVPWEAFRAIAEDYSLELIYKKPFHDIWKEEREDRDLKVLAERMGVVGRDGTFAIDDEQWDACGFYLGFAFRKI
ncbi:uncharacterized protein H6S33_001800 [Morchella sextelata]|uniref:uncharacterized protein n=1 Tax=Morchella sextelata TaxID=1174677 RepID=UPI001D038619|nr:uncharacterized protein H6S33_001800 [Morchella sextelata]KAH0608666.1 hypothetical protein H6S33_001800 [Morchella sextelata]